MHQPTRISIVIATLGGGGAERTAVGLARQWVKGGHHVTMTTLTSSDSDSYEVPEGVRRRTLGGLVDSSSVISAARTNLRRIRSLRRVLREDSPDVIVSFLDTTNARTVLAGRPLGVPIVLCESSDPRYFPLSCTWRLLRRLIYPRAHALVIHAEQIRHWATAVMRRAERVHVVPNAVWVLPDAAASVARAGDQQTVVAMGRLVDLKGFDLLIRAFAMVAGRHPSWKLTIHGEGPERQGLESLVSTSGLGNRVSLPGYTRDPAAVFAGADLFVLSSRTESSPLVLVEAMACGLPVIAFDCPSGPSEVITAGVDGILVPAEDVDSMARALDTLMSDATTRATLGVAARDVRDRFGPDAVMRQWNAVLNTVLRDN